MAFKNWIFKAGLTKNMLKPGKKPAPKQGKKSMSHPVLEHAVSCVGDFFVLGDSGIAGMMNAKICVCHLLPHKVAINTT